MLFCVISIFGIAVPFDVLWLTSDVIAAVMAVAGAHWQMETLISSVSAVCLVSHPAFALN